MRGVWFPSLLEKDLWKSIFILLFLSVDIILWLLLGQKSAHKLMRTITIKFVFVNYIEIKCTCEGHLHNKDTKKCQAEESNLNLMFFRHAPWPPWLAWQNGEYYYSPLWNVRDSNPWPFGCKPNALPTELTFLFCAVCPGEDLNLHTLPHTPLKRKCLPFHHLGTLVVKNKCSVLWNTAQGVHYKIVLPFSEVQLHSLHSRCQRRESNPYARNGH